MRSCPPLVPSARHPGSTARPPVHGGYSIAGQACPAHASPEAFGGTAGKGREVFDFLSWGHLLVLALGALFIFGPERLPTLSRDAARGIRRLRGAIEGIRAQVGDDLGEDFGELRDLDFRRYHPRTFLREQLFGDAPRTTAVSPAVGTPTAPTSSPPAMAQTPLDGVPRFRLPPPVDHEAT